MPQQTRNAQGKGAFCWYEHAAADPLAAKKFYRELFGWDAKDMPMPPGGPGGTYTMFEIRGHQVGGMYQLPPEMKKANVPPHWASYIEVENVEQAFERAKSLGAEGLTPVMDVGDMGRSVMLKDVTGAPFALWQPSGKHTAEMKMLYDHVHGNRCWNELLTNNVDRAGKFYRDLLGWKLEPMQMPTGSYTVFMRGTEQIGGMMEIQKDWGPVPPNWMVYFQVDNIDQAVEIVKRHKGQLHGQIMDIPEVGRVAMLMDPQHAALGFVQPPKK